MEVSISAIVLGRTKQLKGGRKITGSYKVVKLHGVDIINSDESDFRVQANTSEINAVLAGTWGKGSFNLNNECSKILQLKTKRLRKGFNNIVGYQLSTRNLRMIGGKDMTAKYLLAKS